MYAFESLMILEAYQSTYICRDLHLHKFFAEQLQHSNVD